MLSISNRLSTFLDASRWIAASAVVLEHARILVFESYGKDPAYQSVAGASFYFATGFGRIAVIVFFVLSGFLVGGEVMGTVTNGTFSWKRYAIKRVARLYPVYIFALAAGCIFDWIGVHHANPGGMYTGGYHFPGLDFSAAARLNPSALVMNLVFLQGLTSSTFGSNQPLWSIAFEAWYYLLFPLLLWPLISRGAMLASRLMVLGAAAGVVVFIRGEMLTYFLIWLIGLLPHLTVARVRIPCAAALAGLAITIVVARLNLPRLPTNFATYSALALVFACCIIGVAQSGDKMLPGMGIHKRLASFSYSLYASHWPLLLIVVALLKSLLSWGLRMTPSIGAFLFWLALIALSYVFAWCVAQCTEYRTPRVRAFLLRLSGGEPIGPLGSP